MRISSIFSKYVQTTKPPTVYANLVNVRITPNELILDFGCFVPPLQQTELKPPEMFDFDPEVRVILSVVAAQKLGEGLLKASEQHEQASKKTDAAPPAVGNAQ